MVHRKEKGEVFFTSPFIKLVNLFSLPEYLLL